VQFVVGSAGIDDRTSEGRVKVVFSVGRNAPDQSSLSLSRVRAFELHAASFAASNLHLELSTSLNLTEQYTHLVYSSPHFAFRTSFAPPPLFYPIATIGKTVLLYLTES